MVAARAYLDGLSHSVTMRHCNDTVVKHDNDVMIFSHSFTFKDCHQCKIMPFITNLFSSDSHAAPATKNTNFLRGHIHFSSLYELGSNGVDLCEVSIGHAYILG